MTDTAISLTPEQVVQLLDDLRERADQIAEVIAALSITATDERFTPSHEKKVAEALALAEDVSSTTIPAKSFVTGVSELGENTATELSVAGTSPAVMLRSQDAGVSTSAGDTDESGESRSDDRPERGATTSRATSETSERPASAASSPTAAATEPRPSTASTGTAPAPEPSETTAPTAPQPAPQPAPASEVTVPSTGQVSAESTIGMTGPQIIDVFSQTMKQMYPVIPDTSINPRLDNDLSSGTEVRQPADTVYLTDNQTRILAEAIAHNINVRRQAQAEASVMPFGPGIDGGGGFGGTFDMSGINLGAANGYHESVLMLAEQLVNMQPPIPYAWGGGTLEGPSQGISDGGGYADACGDYNKIGFDCSGLSRFVTYQTLGEEIPRTSQPQFTYCTPVAQPMIGDLGFPAGGSPGHVVIYVGNGMILEAQQSGTYMMYSNASPSYVWGRPHTSPNWELEQTGVGY